MNVSVYIALIMTLFSLTGYGIVFYQCFSTKSEKKWVHFLLVQLTLTCCLYFAYKFYAQQAVFKHAYDYCIVSSYLFVLILKILNIDVRSRSGQIFTLLGFFLCICGLVTLGYLRNNIVISQNDMYEVFWFFHMFANCVVMVFLSASLILGFNYLYNQRKIKRHDLSNDFDVSVLSLTKIDQLMSRMLYITFAGVNVSLIAGIVLAHKMWGNAWVKNPKFITSGFMLILFAMLIWGRHHWGWRGKKYVHGLIVCELTLIVLLLLSFLS